MQLHPTTALNIIGTINGVTVGTTYTCDREDECKDCANGVCGPQSQDTLWECTAKSACKAFKAKSQGVVSATAGKYHFYFHCDGTDVCYDMGSFATRPGDVTACCTGYSSCYQSVFKAVDSVNLDCDGYQACCQMEVRAANIQLACNSGSQVCSQMSISGACCCVGTLTNCPKSCKTGHSQRLC